MACGASARPDGAARTSAELADVYQTAATFGHSGVIALAVWAFVRGCVKQFAAEAAGRVRNSSRGAAFHKTSDASALSIYVGKFLADTPSLRSIAPEPLGIGHGADADPGPALVTGPLNDLPRIARHMRSDGNELYDEYGKLIGEAQLREITLIPLLLRIGTLAPTVNWWLAIARVGPPLLKCQAKWQREEGNAVPVDAVLVGEAQAPASNASSESMQRERRARMRPRFKPSELLQQRSVTGPMTRDLPRASPLERSLVAAC
jgi:hypothetical protein